MATPAGYRPIPGSERPRLAGTTLMGPVEPTETVSVALHLRHRAGSPDLPDLAHWQNTPPENRKFLSAEDYGQIYGATDDDVNAVLDYLKSKGLRILETHPGAGRIFAEGSAANINTAFGITLNRYRAPDRVARPRDRGEEGRPFGEHLQSGEQVHRGFDGPAYLPNKLLDVVTAIIGLDDRRLGRNAGAGTGDPPGAAYLKPNQVAERYHFPNFSAAGQTIGLFEAADDAAAYLPSDIAAFIGTGTPPHLKDVLLLGNVNNPALVVPFNGSAFECTLDIECAAAVAPGVNINVYFTNRTELGWDAFFHRATFPLPGDAPPSVLSASWVGYWQDDVGTIGSAVVPGTPAHHFHRHLRRAAARGISVLMAIGDWGANNAVFDTLCHVTYPSCDPWVTACGGTILGTSAEWTWSDAHRVSPFDQPPYCSTGGGVSDQFPRPPYQVAAGVLPISKNDGGVRRGVPDVSGMVAMTGLVFAGSPSAGFGTSAVAPLYAGLVAVINAFLGRNVGFLNPTLYRYGPEICNDIVVGNNDSGNTPDSAFYTADIGWDPCTGWGSLNGLRLLSALAPAPIAVTAIADSGDFGEVCVGSFVDRILTINNSGFSDLRISDVSVAPAADFLAPGVSSYPIVVSPGGSIDIVIRFQPGSTAPINKNATITIVSNELFSPHTLNVSGTAGVPRLVLAIADSGNFGNVCVGSFADEPLVVNNSGRCPLIIDRITSSSAEFLVPEMLFYPIVVAPGAAVSLPIRFQPDLIGPTAPGTHLTVISNDPGGPRTLDVSGSAPAGKLAVTGSTFFGDVHACCREERVISICNVGDCKLHVSSVAFKRKSRHWKLINNPFPATLHPGSCLAVVVVYKATEKYPRPCEIVVESDDPLTPVKCVELLAATIWGDCGCRECCEERRKGRCEKRHCEPSRCGKCGEEEESEMEEEEGEA